MEDDLNILEMEDNLNFLKKEKYLKFLKMEDDIRKIMQLKLIKIKNNNRFENEDDLKKLKRKTIFFLKILDTIKK
jgi:hypothetical protein